MINFLVGTSNIRVFIGTYSLLKETQLTNLKMNLLVI